MFYINKIRFLTLEEVRNNIFMETSAIILAAILKAKQILKIRIEALVKVNQNRVII
jgi:hypothetical protein